MSPVFGDRFIKQAPATAFVEILRILDPRYFFEPFKEIYYWIEPWHRTLDGLRKLDSYGDEFLSNVRVIISKRVAAGHRLRLHEYKYLLHCARVLARHPLARDVWSRMLADGIEPDLESYNYYMEANVWAGAYRDAERWTLQVRDHHFNQRQAASRSLRYRGHKTGQYGLSHSMLSRFRDMASKGLDGNESTFIQLMIAMGRNRDMDGIKSLLRSVWNIDVDLLQELDEEELETPTFYQEGSPLAPSTQLLFAIAHVYGINSNIKLGLQLVDFVSRQYNLEVPMKVWSQLMEWSYALQTYRSPHYSKESEHFDSRLPSSAVDSLWKMMLDEPYRINPDVPMCSMQAKAMRRASDLDAVLDAMRRARDLHAESRSRLVKFRLHAYRVNEEVRQRYDDAVAQNSGETLPFWILPARWFVARRELLLAELLTHRDRKIIWRDARRLLEHPLWSVETLEAEWTYRRRPKLVEEWEAWLPNELRLESSTGYVDIDTKSARTQRIRQDYTPAWEPQTLITSWDLHIEEHGRQDYRSGRPGLASRPERHDELLRIMLSVSQRPVRSSNDLRVDVDRPEDGEQLPPSPSILQDGNQPLGLFGPVPLRRG